MTALPTICDEMRLQVDSGVVLANSRDVAEFCDKRHADVLRDIEALKIDADLRRCWFRPTTVFDSYGREQPAFDLTRQGFTLLTMGYGGERAMTFKVRYIQAFDAMEAALNQGVAVTGTELMGAVREIVSAVVVRFDGHDRALERIEKRQDSMAEDVASIKLRILNGRRKLSPNTKAIHIADELALGGRCPCCGESIVVTVEGKSKFAQFDHFYANSQPNADHTWLICSPCHSGLTTGRIPRDQREAEFRAYQNKRRRLPGRQMGLF